MIYKIIEKENTWSIFSEDDFEFDGSPILNYKPPKLKYVRRKLRISIFNFGIDAFIMTTEAHNLLASHLKPYGEFVDVQCEKDRLKLFNCTFFIDCFDKKASIYKYDKVLKNYYLVERLVLKTGKIKNVLLFKLPEFPRSGIFFTDKFKQLLTEYNLDKGLNFIEANHI